MSGQDKECKKERKERMEKTKSCGYVEDEEKRRGGEKEGRKEITE